MNTMTDAPRSNPIVDKATGLLKEFHEEARQLRQAATAHAIEALRVAWMGRKGRVTGLMEELRSVSKEDRPAAGKALNDLRQQVEASLEELKTAAASQALAAKLSAPAWDITLPASKERRTGSVHPVNLVRSAILREFRRLGFTVYDGPEMDHDFYNFSSLNFPKHHPARDMQDTFFVAGDEGMVMRTHTSNIQIHAMLNERPPLRVVSLGRVYRCDSDLTHTPMFHQCEGFVVDRDISFGDMKGTLDVLLKAVFGPGAETRMRPSFFPFVEPGAEVDMRCVSCEGKGCRICKMTGWLEIAGCGMIHPNVFESVGYDSEEYTGFAFGFGLDRMAMLKYGLGNLRQLFEADHAFLGQFPVFASF
jgi:phenylalanyl-tRNA synthetase alpha chain